MISVEPVFALNSVKAQILQHFNNETLSIISEAEISDLRIVGYERPDVVLVSWNSKAANQTYISVFSMDTQTLEILHKSEVLMNVYCASVNGDRNLIAFTRGDRSSYEALIAETKAPYRIFSLGHSSKTFSRVQFVDDLNDSRLYRVLIIHEKEQILLYSLQVNSDNRLSGQPKKEKTFTRKHSWFKWDYLCQTLFFIGPKVQKFESTLMNLTLHIYQMGALLFKQRSDKRKSMFYQNSSDLTGYMKLWSESEILLPAEIQSAELYYSCDICMPPHSIKKKPLNCLDIIRSSTGKRDSLTLVMRNHERAHLCLYSSYRSESDVDPSGIAYSDSFVASFPGMELLNYLVINSVGDANNSKLPIIFPLAKYLLIYFPGSELHFVDCFDNHELSSCLTLKEKELIELGINDLFDNCFGNSAEDLYEFPLVQQDTSCLSFSGCIYDKKNCVAYRIGLELTDALLFKFYKLTCRDQLEGFVHFCIFHAGYWMESREIKELISKIIYNLSFRSRDEISNVLKLFVSSSVNRYMRENEKLKERAIQILPIDIKSSAHRIEPLPFEATFRKTEAKTGKTVTLHLYNSANQSTNMPVDIQYIISDMSSESLSQAPLSCNMLKDFTDNPIFIESEYSRLSKTFGKDKYDNSSKKKWDVFMNRIFNPSSSSFQSISGMIDIDNEIDEAPPQKNTSGDLNELVRAVFVDKLSEEFYCKITSCGISSGLSSSSPSSSSLSKSFKNFQISDAIGIQEDLKEYTNSLAAKYSQIQMYNAALLWNVLSDIIDILKTHNIAGCSCENCKGKVLKKYSNNSQTTIFDRRTSALFASQFRDASFRRNSRVDYIANVMRSSIKSDQINNTGIDVSKKMLADFRIVEQYYAALEKLCLPLPVELHTKFAVLAFHALNRMLFLQYLDRGIIRVTEGFLKHAIDILDHQPTEQDKKFKISLMARFKNNKKKIKLFNENGYSEFDKIAVQDIISKLLKEEQTFMADNVMEFKGVRPRKRSSASNITKNIKNRDSMSFADIMSDISEESGAESAMSETEDPAPPTNPALRTSRSSPIDMFPNSTDNRKPFQSKSAVNLRMSSDLSMKLSKSDDTEASVATCSPDIENGSMNNDGVYDFSPSKILLNYLALKGLNDRELSIFSQYLSPR